MLTDLSFIADDRPWPPKDDDEKVRLQEHAFNRNVYNGLHDKIFPRYITYLADAPKDSKKQPIILDWPELATTSYLNLLFGEEPEIKAPLDDDQLPERPDDEVFTDCSRYGHGLYEISEDGIGIQAINPENVYLVVQPGNIRNVTAYVIFATFKQTDADKKEHEYIKFTIHTFKQIQHLVFELKNSKLEGPKDLKIFSAFALLQVDQQGIQRPEVDDFLIVHVQNQLSSERYYGRSDYKPSIITLIESLELSFAQRDEVLAKFVNPTPVIPESATIFDHGTQEWVYKPGKPIITNPGDSRPELLTWSADLGSVERTIEQKMDQLITMLQLSLDLVSPNKNIGTAESGSALRIRLIPTIAKISKFAREAEWAIPKVLNLWSQLHPPVMPLKDIHVLLQDGIPEDPLETATVMQLYDAMGSVSLESKLEARGLTEGTEAFNIELARIRGNQQALNQQNPVAPKIELPPLGA